MRALLLALLLAGCATGETLVTGTAREAVAPESVQIYLEAPPQYEVIGAVSASSSLGVSGQQNLDRAIAEVRQRAASMGANGVIIDYMGAPGGASPMAGVNTGGVVTLIPTRDAGDREVRARAVFVPNA